MRNQYMVVAPGTLQVLIYMYLFWSFWRQNWKRYGVAAGKATRTKVTISVSHPQCSKQTVDTTALVKCNMKIQIASWQSAAEFPGFILALFLADFAGWGPDVFHFLANATGLSLQWTSNSLQDISFKSLCSMISDQLVFPTCHVYPSRRGFFLAKVKRALAIQPSYRLPGE